MALKHDGTVWTWGFYLFGPPGNASNTSNLPVQVSGLANVVAIAGGGPNAGNYLALKGDGTVWAWGSGPLGNGSSDGSNVPVQVSGLANVTAISVGYFLNFVLKSDGTVWAWGYAGTDGFLGNGSNTDSLVPVQVSGLTGVLAVSAGGDFSLALRNDGTVWAWGDGAHGELGNGTNASSNVPVQVTGIAGGFNSLVAGVVAIAAGGSYGLALRSNGTVWAWGGNLDGELGNGSSVSIDIPVQVSQLAGAVAVSARGNHSLALKSDGTVWAWGYNQFGQLGDGGKTNSDVPVHVTGLTGMIAVAAGAEHSLALKDDGTVWAWGAGPLGNGTTANANSSVPIQVSGLTNVVAIAAGGVPAEGTLTVQGAPDLDDSLALKSDGTVWAWGFNKNGELGNGEQSLYSYVPVQVTGLTGVVAIAAGGGHNLALRSDGSVVAWGDNRAGQLCNGSLASSNVPVPSGLGGSAIAAGAPSAWR